MENKIPKKIHYCWFGGNPLSELAQRCIASWKKYCPDYEIIEWNESNFDINCCVYVQEAYGAQKWAFVSDVARLFALVKYGGIYMDTDVEVLKSLDDILMYEAVSGFEAKERINTGLMACRKGHAFFDEFLREYDGIHFLKEDGSYDLTTNVTRITSRFLKSGVCLNNSMQTVKGVTLFPSDFFCPKDNETKEILLTENTYVIHHFDGSWVPEEYRYRNELIRKYQKKYPPKIVGYIAAFVASVKYRGIKAGLYEVISWMKRKRKKCVWRKN